MRPLTACQVRAARAMMCVSIRELAERSAISESSIRRIESSFGIPQNVSLDLLARLHVYFESVGFTFVIVNGERGLRWGNYPGNSNGPPASRSNA